jgi:cell division protein FtsL
LGLEACAGVQCGARFDLRKVEAISFPPLLLLGGLFLGLEKETSLRAQSSPSLPALLGILASYAALVAGIVIVRRSPSTLNQPAIDPAQEQDSTNRDGRIRANENRTPPVGIAEHQVAEATSKQRNPQRRRKKIRKLRKAGLTWISTGTFIVILTYTIITNHLWETTRNSVQQLRRQIAMEHRAWLLVDTDYSDTFRATKDFVEIPFRLTNIGKSPAEHIQGSVEVDEIPQSQIATFDFAPGRSHNAIKSGLIYPGFPHTTTVSEWIAKGKPVKVDASKRKMFLNRQIVFVIQGRITYDDVFHVSHSVEFCHAISANTAAHAQRCVDKNRIDSFDE